MGVRKIQTTDNTKLRLFFLSILWRSAATNRPEFSEISLSSDDLKRLGQMLIDRDPNPQCLFPISLIQLSSMGRIHNLSPIRQLMVVPALTPDAVDHSIPIFRFYFDGLIFHIPVNPQTDVDVKAKGNLILGQESDFLVSTVPYEKSFQLENLANIAKDTNRAMQEGMWSADNLKKAAKASKSESPRR